jgi:hypothetical protein
MVARLTPWSRLVGCLLLSAWTTLAASARAEPPRRPALHWSRTPEAASCIDPRALALRVIELTGPVLVAASDADVSIEGQIERLAEGTFRASVTATGTDGVQRGTRTLEQQGDCRALDQALAFVIALLIDPDLVLQKLPAGLVALGAEGAAPEVVLLRELEASPPVPVLLEKPARSATPTPASASIVQPARTRYRLSAGLTLGLAELPRTTAGVTASFAALPRAWLALELSVRAAFMLGTADVDGRSVAAQSFGADLLLCPRYPRAHVFFDLCAGPLLTIVHAEGRGFDADQSATLLGFGALLAPGVGVRATKAWFLHLRGYGRVLFNTPEFTYSLPDGDRSAFALARFSGGLNLTVGHEF